MTSPRPPRLGRLLIRLLPLGDRREHVEADLLELYRTRAATEGRWRAGWSYLGDAASLWLRVRSRGATTRPRTLQLTGARHDVVFALRLFRRQPVTFGIAVAGLALAIGLTTTVFSVVNAMLLRPLGVASPETLFRVTTSVPGRSSGPWMHADVFRLSQQDLPLEIAVASFYDGYIGAPQPGQVIEPDKLPSSFLTSVGGNYFSMLGVGSTIGRTLVHADDRPGAERVVVLSHAYWRTRFGGDRAILGRTLRLSLGPAGTPVTVVGVAARGFGGTEIKQAAPAGWMTLTAMREAAQEQALLSVTQRRQRIADLKARSALTDAEREGLRTLEAGLEPPRMSDREYVKLFGRVPAGANRTQAEDLLTTLAIAAAKDRGQTDPSVRPQVRLEPIDPPRSTTVYGIALPFVAGALALVVALACANVTNLLLASAASRQREIGTRLAIGAGRARIVRQLLTESVMLAVAAGAAGLALSIWAVPVVAPWLGLPRLIDAGPDFRVYAFVASLSVLVGVLAGLAPARHGWRADLMGALKSDTLAASSPVRRSRLRSLLIGGQAAGALVLLVLAALLTRSIIKVSTEDLGLDVEHLVTFQGIGRGYDAVRSRVFWDTALERVRGIDGVAGAALTTVVPFSAFGPVRLRDGRSAERHETSAEYFEAMGIAILRGRTFTRDEIESDAPVAVISARLARTFWPDDEPIGSMIERVWPDGGVPGRSMGRELATRLTNARVVGVVDDVSTLSTYEWPSIYLPLANTDTNLVNATLIARTRTDPGAVARTIHDALRSIDPEVQHYPRLVRDTFQSQLQYPRHLAAMAVTVGLCALGLAVVGLFGVTAFVANRRQQEIGVRLALGATPRAVVRLLLGDSLKPVLIGLTCGVAAALVIGRASGSAMYGVSPHDPIAIGAAVIVLLASAIAAAVLPVRRAAAIDPARVLRES